MSGWRVVSYLVAGASVVGVRYSRLGTTLCRRMRRLEVEPRVRREICDGVRGNGRTDYSELDRHVESKDVEDDLEWGPFLCAEEPPCPWRQDEGVPCSDCERTDEEVLVC